MIATALRPLPFLRLALGWATFLLLVLPHVARAEEKLDWKLSLPQALKAAREENKVVMAYFTGSDWCGYCQMLEGEVFATPEFERWATRNVVPLYLDFPKLTALAPEQERQNNALREKMGIEALPRVVFIDGEGQTLSALGYVPGGPKVWLDMARVLLPKKTETENSLAEARRHAAALGKPLLVLSRIGEAAQAKAKIDAFLSDPSVRRNSGDNFVVCNLNLATAGSGDLALWREISAQHQTGAEYPAALLLGSRGEELLKTSGAHFRPDEVSSQLGRLLPKPAYHGEWLTDLPAAMTLARALNRPLLLNFTGSDWCGYCQKLDEDVFSQPAFRSFAGSNLVLVTLDFPKTKEQPDQLRLQNKFVRETFGIEGFPYELILDNTGNPLGEIRYTGDTAESFLSQLRGALAPQGHTGGK